jgi:phosphoadenosine phosphosulfate reductase
LSAIERHAREREGFEVRVEQASQRLVQAAAEHAGTIVQATSLGAEGMVVTDLIVRAGLPIPVATLDTGLLHEETRALIGRIRARYGITVECHRPDAEAVVHFVHRHGVRAMRESVALREACCDLRKVRPMERLLAGRSAWITGRWRAQAETRSTLDFVETAAGGRTKVNPIADWDWADVWHYIATREVPYNALHDHFYPSIGCAPCTRAVTPGEPLRAGRWWWEGQGHKECGLHLERRPAMPTARARQ